MVEAHVWNEKLDVGNEAMDHEHHLQIGLVSAFVDAVEQRRPALARRFAEQLLSYSGVHFASEDLLMEGSAYADRQAHGRDHEAFLEQMRGLARAFAEGETEAAIAAALDLRGALAAHIADADRRLASHVAPARAGLPAASPAGG